ncbi:MAG: cupin domain-containing protein [Spirochaetes bacterium]|nr:cupin domain-containing protein [Spirochaetota bacterium]
MGIEKINLTAAAAGIPEPFRYLKVGDLNDHALHLLRRENRTLEFHVYEDSDGLFYVIGGSMQLELRGRAFHLEPGDLLIVSRGAEHRPVCTGHVEVLLIERSGTLSRANTGGTFGY